MTISVYKRGRERDKKRERGMYVPIYVYRFWSRFGRLLIRTKFISIVLSFYDRIIYLLFLLV